MLRKLVQGLRSLRRGDSDPDWEFDERRELFRMRCHYEVEGELNGAKFPGQVVDMSLGGLKLRSFQNMVVGQVVDLTYCEESLEVPERTISCRVQWVRRRDKDGVHFAGLSYDASDIVLGNSWIKMVLKQLGFRPDKIFQRRKYVRADCVVAAHLILDSQLSVPGKLYNLGAQGALVECTERLDEGRGVELQIGPLKRLRKLQVPGRVVQATPHHHAFLIGVQFAALTEKTTDQLGKYIRHFLMEHWAH